MHSATVEIELSINLRCRTIKEYALPFSTREFDTCQTKGCCSRVPYFRRSNGVRPYEGFVSVRCSNLKENRGWGARQSTARIFEFLGDLARTDRPQLSFVTTHCVSQACLLFGQKEITRFAPIAGAALLITPSPFSSPRQGHTRWCRFRSHQFGYLGFEGILGLFCVEGGF